MMVSMSEQMSAFSLSILPAMLSGPTAFLGLMLLMSPLDPRPSDLHYKLIVMGIVHIVTVRKVRPAFFPELLSPDASLNGEL